MTVYLVGAGPGDPGLLTVRGASLLGRADVVVHDRLVAPELLELVPAGAEVVDVGKRPGRPHRQQDINQLLVDRGRTGATVVRLKGGDPFLFGRGGEEVEALVAAGVPVVVVPGVTSAVAAPSAAGVPVTHRGLSTSVTVVTGHAGDSGEAAGVDWASLAAAGGTLVVLMGMRHRAAIADALVAGGRPPDTPVAVVHWGTTAQQRSLRTTLAGLADAAMDPPATIVVGPVAALSLGSVEDRPLHGLRVVVTRPRHQADGLAGALAEAGASVVVLPVLVVDRPADGGAALAAAVDRVRAGDYRWLVLTSANAVDALASAMRDGRDLAGVRLAAVGDATAAALAAVHLRADLVASVATAEGLAADVPAPSAGERQAPTGARILYPRAADARPVLAEGLRAKGWTVDDVEAYRTRPAAVAELPGDALDGAGAADVVTFASPSAVTAYLALAGPPAGAVACIGPVTARAATDAGLSVDVVADRPGAAPLVEALVRWRAALPPPVSRDAAPGDAAPGDPAR